MESDELCFYFFVIVTLSRENIVCYILNFAVMSSLGYVYDDFFPALLWYEAIDQFITDYNWWIH